MSKVKVASPDAATSRADTVAALVNRMLAPEPGDRYPGMTALLAAIQTIAALPAESWSTDPPTLED